MDELEIWIESMTHRLQRSNEYDPIEAGEVLAYMVRLAELVQERTRPPQ